MRLLVSEVPWSELTRATRVAEGALSLELGRWAVIGLVAVLAGVAVLVGLVIRRRVSESRRMQIAGAAWVLAGIAYFGVVVLDAYSGEGIRVLYVLLTVPFMAGGIYGVEHEVEARVRAAHELEQQDGQPG